MLPVNDLVEHLKNKHKARTVKAHSPGKFKPGWFRNTRPLQQRVVWTPKIISKKDQTFFLQVYKTGTTWIFWVTILGSKDEADKYEFKISIGNGKEKHFSTTFRGKVFSTDEKGEHPPDDNKYVLKLDNGMAEIRSDGYKTFMIDCLQIIKKKNPKALPPS